MKKTILLSILTLGLTYCASGYKKPEKGLDTREIKPLFLKNGKTGVCSPAEDVNGKNFRPEEVMDNYPECFVENGEMEGTYVMDCKSSKLSTEFFYANTMEICDSFKDFKK